MKGVKRIVDPAVAKIWTACASFLGLYFGRVLVGKIALEGGWGLMKPSIEWTLGSAAGSWTLGDIVYHSLLTFQQLQGTSASAMEQEAAAGAGFFTGLTLLSIMFVELVARVGSTRSGVID